jgi:hypothetical protein
MGKRYDFDVTICENSVFQYKKMDEKDLELLRHYNIKQWDGEDFENESILKYGKWVISKSKDMFLKGLGGGSFEIPEMYQFVFVGGIVHIECGGGGTSSRSFKHNKDGSYDEEIIISRTYYTNYNDKYDSIDVNATIAEAFAIDGFRSPHLNRLSVIF